VTHSSPKEGLSLGSPGVYRIVVQGFLDHGASDFLGGVRITTDRRAEDRPTTTLEGQLRDQAELLGVLNSLYELHLPILAVELLEAE
jgi:hypothetical protein